MQKLADEEPTEEQEPNPCNDEALEAAVSQVLQETMTKKDCKIGAVYVVETKTGNMKANISLMRKGKSFMPYEDTYTEEQSNMLFGPTYLALLSSGKVTPYAMIDTEFGIYKDVRDHNWRRGGYGVLTLENALGCHSLVAFTKAKEMVYGNDHAAYNQKISSYLGTTPNHALGILTFYNAVANGGRMVKLMTEGDDVIVLNDQIAAPENIATLQQGLLRAVSQGLFRRTGRDYTDVAACGRTFHTDKKTRRMELCGYFPADNPIYTIMVVLEKNGLPAGAGAVIFESCTDCRIDVGALGFGTLAENTLTREENGLALFREHVKNAATVSGKFGVQRLSERIVVHSQCPVLKFPRGNLEKLQAPRKIKRISIFAIPHQKQLKKTNITKNENFSDRHQPLKLFLLTVLNAA